MRSLVVSICLLAGLLCYPTEVLGQDVSIQILATFDYPGVGNSTTAGRLNDRSEVAGFYRDAANVTRGFVRQRNGVFSDPIVDPDDTGNFTVANDINNSRLICGYFLDADDGFFHGFLLAGNTFTQFDAGTSVSTLLRGLNDAGVLVGSTNSSTQPDQAFISENGNTTFIVIPGAISSLGSDINANGEMDGIYTDGAGMTHGFFRDANGTLRFPIDYPGATSTSLEGINDLRWMSGRYTDNVGIVHGFLFIPPRKFVSFDYPGAVETSLNGINNEQILSGRYLDNVGVRHSFIARVNR
jgi:hypothetical protein